MKIAVLTSPNQWFVPYAQELSTELGANLLHSHEKFPCTYEVCFILSYHKIIPKEFLQNNQKNIIIHASDLPQGKGWSPLFWQVLEGKNDIVFSVFEANEGMDDGAVYFKKILLLDGDELYEQLREKQALFTLVLCKEFLQLQNPVATAQSVNMPISIYPKRNPQDHKLDVNKSIKEQFDLLRVSNNEEFPAYFEINGKHYKLEVSRK